MKDRLQQITQVFRRAPLLPRRAAAASLPGATILTCLDGLTAEQERELACVLSLLWTEFVFTIGGLSGFRLATAEVQSAYLTSLVESSDLVRRNGGVEKQHYSFAPDLLALYVEGMRKAERSPQDCVLASTVVRLIDLGARLRAGGLAAYAG